MVYYVSRILGLLAIMELNQLKKTIGQSMPLFDTASESLLMVVRLLLQVMVFLHCASLLLNLLRKVERASGSTQTWVEANNLPADSELELYLLGWYWASTILSTVGFGDISPSSTSAST